MKELSLNILDITQNSISAGAANISILLTETIDGWLTLKIKDDGCGMSDEVVKKITDPFYTTRTTRKVGLGIPLLTLASEQTGGCVTIASKVDNGVCNDHGTEITATFNVNSIDFTPIGDMISTICILIQGSDTVDFVFNHTTPHGCVSLSTVEMRSQLGDVPLSSFEVIQWVREYLQEQYSLIN